MRSILIIWMIGTATTSAAFERNFEQRSQCLEAMTEALSVAKTWEKTIDYRVSQLATVPSDYSEQREEIVAGLREIVSGHKKVSEGWFALCQRYPAE
ncbi:MAG: hypothetical protein JXR13_18755 [Thalassovita sp.]